MIYMRAIETPIGPLTLFATDDALVRISFNDGPSEYDLRWCRKHFDDLPKTNNDSAVLTHAVDQLTEYFEGKRQNFDLPIVMHGTPYQQKVWQRLRSIPYGKVVSYGDLAKELGSVARAVGSANGSNPISIIVPCHRVIAADGTLCGFGGGLDAKEALLRHEGATFDPHRPEHQAVLF